MRSNDWSDTITTGKLTRVVSQHLREETHRDITPERVEYILENWVVRGVRTSPDGRSSWIYLAFPPGLERMVRVAISMDDRRIATAFIDGATAKHWNNSNLGYFNTHYQNLEVRDES